MIDGAGKPRSPRPWSHVIPPEEQTLYDAAGLGTRSGIGRNCALLVIDLQYRAIGARPLPIAESIREFPMSCGQDGWDAVPHIARLIAAFREENRPVIYLHVAQKKAENAQRMADKIPNIMKVPPEGYAFVREVAPEDGDIIIPKHHASGFFGTPLASHLVNLGIDTLFVTGCTTSGCVRATAVDGASYGYRIVVPHECVFDRSRTSHAVNLFDLASKYGDVVSTDEAVALIHARPNGEPTTA